MAPLLSAVFSGRNLLLYFKNAVSYPIKCFL
jgi:hypothetical protein